jgi:hypothetical protein
MIVFDERPVASFWIALILMLAAMYLALSRKPAN